MDVVGERLFAIDILAGVQCGDGDEGMPVVRCGDDDGVDILALQQLAEIGISLTAFEARLLVLAVTFFDRLFGKFTAVRVHIADGDDLDFFAAQEAV